MAMWSPETEPGFVRDCGDGVKAELERNRFRCSRPHVGRVFRPGEMADLKVRPSDRSYLKVSTSR